MLRALAAAAATSAAETTVLHSATSDQCNETCRSRPLATESMRRLTQTARQTGVETAVWPCLPGLQAVSNGVESFTC